MYLLDAVTVLARRWYVVLLGVALVAAAGTAVIRYVPTTYQASGQLLILLPVGATGAETPTNPYLNAPLGLTTTASLLAANAITKDAEQSIADAGYTAEYSVSVVPGAGPLLVVTSKGTGPDDVIATRDEVIMRIDDELSLIQQEVAVPTNQFMFTSPSSITRTAEVLPGSKLRVLIGVTGAGGILVLAFTFSLDRLLIARRRRREAEVEGTPETAWTATDEDDPSGSGSGNLEEVAEDRDRQGASPTPHRVPVPRHAPVADPVDASATSRPAARAGRLAPSRLPTARNGVTRAARP